MKRASTVIVCFLLAFALSACANPLLERKKPCQQRDTTWTSEDGSISFIVFPHDESGGASGELTAEGKTVKFYLEEDFGHMMELYPYDAYENGFSDPVFPIERWECSYICKSSFVATVQETTYFEIGQKITFYRLDNSNN